eukprot:12889118-Prorocentrum_lima.AAC.1
MASEAAILTASATALQLQPGGFYLNCGLRLLNDWTGKCMRRLEDGQEITICMRLRGGDPDGE